MPFIVLKRSDIPPGTLQVLDLQPNESQRNLIYDPPGQTKYVNPVENDQVVVEVIGAIGQLHRSYRGLAAWFITNVNDGTGAQSVGNFAIAAGNAAPGDTVTIDTSPIGGPSVTFTFTAGAPVLTTDVQVGGDNLISATNLFNAVSIPGNGLLPYITPDNTVPGSVGITAVAEGAAGDTIVLSEVSANITATAMAGGVDAGPLTAANANTIAANILANLIRFGDLTLPAVVSDLAAVNGEVAAVVGTASITAAQLTEVLGILAGRRYLAPQGTQVADTGVFDVQPAVGTANGPRFLDPSTRTTYESGALTISWAEGELEGFRAQTFEYQGIPGNPNGEAVVVFNNDGTLFTL